MQAEIKVAWGQWFVTPLDGTRGGIAMASREAAVKFCEERGWEIKPLPRISFKSAGATRQR